MIEAIDEKFISGILGTLSATNAVVTNIRAVIRK
jgi:hypothetical protein